MRIRYELILGSMIILMVFTSGCEDDDDGTPPPNISRGWIESGTDEFIFQSSGGELSWDDYQVMIRLGNETYNLTTKEGKTSKGGEMVNFKDPDGLWDPVQGIEYNVKIIDKIENKVVWEDDIIAK